MIVIPELLEQINSPVRTIVGRAELFSSFAPAISCSPYGRLKSFTVERSGEAGKFFGYGICHKLKMQLLDKNREISISKDMEYRVIASFHEYYPYPTFYVNDISRDENTNDLEIVAYDALYKASDMVVGDLDITAPYTLAEFAEACGDALQVSLQIDEAARESFELLITDEEGARANFDGSESLRSALDAIAEATQTIYYLDGNANLVFKRLDMNGAPAYQINKSQYFNLQSKEPVTLGAIVHTTELGDTVNPTMPPTLYGKVVTQYVRNNPFWELRSDLYEIVDKAQTIRGISAHPFNCDWRGNYLLEPGDKISLVTKDDGTIETFLLNETIEYNGALSGKISWEYTEDNEETADNPTSLGEAINQTFAKVDKVNREINIVASAAEANAAAISALQVNTDSISASVTKIETDVQESIDSINENIEQITKQAFIGVTEEQVQIAITTEMEKGASKVVTSTGYTFDEAGLTVSKEGSEMTTQITEDGMAVFRDEQQVLTANNTGVNAINLHANTYLIIGEYSRFENYGSNRTGCFWIGG